MRVREWKVITAGNIFYNCVAENDMIVFVLLYNIANIKLQGISSCAYMYTVEYIYIYCL